MPRIFITCHPNDEPNYSHAKIGEHVTIPWNTSPKHRRKFISRKGLYLKENKVCEGTLNFWGEYEPPTDAVIVSTDKPKAIHYKLTPVRGETPQPPKGPNTDPYVFGEHFKHICCGIGNRKYQQNDIVLLGHIKLDKEQGEILGFELDTVIVIKETVKVRRDHPWNESQYYNASIRPLEAVKTTDYFYIGFNYKENPTCFSFVPCKIDGSTDTSPILDLYRYGFNPKQSYYGYVAKHISFTDASGFWEKLATDIRSQGWELGIHLDKI